VHKEFRSTNIKIFNLLYTNSEDSFLSVLVNDALNC